MAPIALASGCVITFAVTLKLSSNKLLTLPSTSSRTLAGTAPVAGKSNRKRPGEFSDPA